MSRYLTNHWVNGSVFMYFQKVSWWREDRRLVSILHYDFNSCRIFERSHADETRVNIYVGCFYLQSIGSFGLKVQRLLRMTETNAFYWWPQQQEKENTMPIDGSIIHLSSNYWVLRQSCSLIWAAHIFSPSILLKSVLMRPQWNHPDCNFFLI